MASITAELLSDFRVDISNGTHIWDGGANVWVRLVTDVPQVVLPGARGAVGQRTFVYESPHRR